MSTKGPLENKFPFWGVEAPSWQGARRERLDTLGASPYL